MKITPLRSENILEACALFADKFRRQREAVPVLPRRMEDPGSAASSLENLLAHSSALAAFDGDRLVGYLGWWLVDGFRDTDGKAAYCPVWAHAVAGGQEPRVYRALYRAAAAEWLKAGCHTHAITILASDEATCQVWFWNGFGLIVVDAVRPLDSMNIPAPNGYTLRKAAPTDAEALAEIEAEHWRHYAEPPTLMVVNWANSVEELRQLLAIPENSFWTAWKGSELAGYMRFECASHGAGAAEMVNDPGTRAITGAYVRPQHRGQRLSPALLDAALADFKTQGLQRCSVDFESFNPEAAAFWPKYFALVCLSLVRVPERSL